MRALLRWSLLALFVSARAQADVPPEVQLCLQHLKPSERERAARALGPLEALPRYRVQLEVDPKERLVWGKVQVELTARGGRPLSELYLRLTPNARARRVSLSQVKLNGQPVTLEQGPEPTLSRLALPSPLAPGASATLEMSVKATVPRAPAQSGSLLGGGGAASGGDHGAFSATSDFLSLVGVVPQVPPLDDQGKPWAGPQGIGDLALYEPAHVLATVTVPPGWTAHATGAPMGEVPEPDGRVRFGFAAAAVRDFPVFVSRGYRSETTTVNGVTVESHFLPRDEASAQRVLKYATQALSEFERRLGPLPYTHFRVVEAPLSGGAGGMEFPGLVTVATSLYRASTDPSAVLSGMAGMEDLQALLGDAGGGAMAQMGATLERTLEFTVAHEVAHQYFAALVGSDPINAPVVDESLAQYAAVLYFEWAHGKPAAERMRREGLVTPYHFYRLSGGEDGRADRATGDFDDEMQYGALVYGKAPLFHQAARQLVGDAPYFQGLRSYVDTYRFKWTCKECLVKELAKASPAHTRALGALRVRWWEEAHGDADLGAPDLGSMMGGLGDMKLDAETRKMLEEILPQLTGQ
ncbi:aminopeptidase [Myxococcaceae bacterium JPH2]|nr:aminopeptidase [Myxococcaceae bacterium JPH2]